MVRVCSVADQCECTVVLLNVYVCCFVCAAFVSFYLKSVYATDRPER